MIRDSNNPLLSSDALGEKGEAKFADLCTDVDLTVNRVGRDRSGWDFVVQQDAVAAAHIPLDARPALWTSFVQVKAVWRDHGRARIRLTLSAAERIAKQSNPAYIAAFRFNRNDLNDYDLYLIELADDQLAAILKALRKAQANGACAINARKLKPLCVGATRDTFQFIVACGGVMSFGQGASPRAPILPSHRDAIGVSRRRLTPGSHRERIGRR